MDAFEEIVAGIFEGMGYWVRRSYKVLLTKEEKRKIKIPTSPRLEIDLLAYLPGKKDLRVIECKSFFNSRGVSAYSLFGVNAKRGKKYKLFNNIELRRVVFNRLVKQLADAGACPRDITPVLWLAAGKIRQGDEATVREGLRSIDCQILTPMELADMVREAAASRYENNIAVMVSKLLKQAGYLKSKEEG